MCKSDAWRSYICESSVAGHESCRTRWKWILPGYYHTDRIHTHWCFKHRIRFVDTTVLPKGETADGLKYSLNQGKYLKVFLDNLDVPIDNSASERAIRTFCLGKKNWMFHNIANGANSSALVYSISETAKLNNLRPYYYFKYILTELPKHCDEKGNIDSAELDYLMPWSESLPEECRKPRRS